MSPAGQPVEGTGSHTAQAARGSPGTQKAGDAESESWQHLLSPHILVVDDEPTIREVLTCLLENERYRVTEAGTATEALQALQGPTVHVLLTDVMLPDMDGITLMEQALDADPKISGIVMTGFGTIDLAVKAIRAGAAEFLTKPLQPDVVLLTVQRQLKFQLLRQENALLKKASLRSGGIRVRSFHPNEADAGAGSSGRSSAEYQRGLADGERRAQGAIAAARAKEQGLVATLVRELERTTRAQMGEIEDQTSALAFEIATKVVREAAEQKRSLIVTQVREAVAKARGRAQEKGLVQIKVNPGDMPFLETVRAELGKDAEAGASIRLEPDPSITAGGCRVETSTRIVDATLEAQLARLGDALKRR